MTLVIRTTGLEQYAPGGEARIKVLLIGGPDAGKRLDVDSHVATPAGWRRYGDLAVGDQVIGSNGHATVVLGAYDNGAGPAYRVTFSDGASVIADPEHLWTVWTRKLREDCRPPITLTTAQILARGLHGEREGHSPRPQWYLPLVAPVQYDKRDDLPIGPYLLGSLLANGSFTSHTVTLTTNDESVTQRCRDENPELDVVEQTSPGYCRRWRIKGMHKVLEQLGIDQLKSGLKFVPALYITAHEQARRDILAGLMDGDGSVGDHRRARFHSTSPQLASGVQQLVWSLGGVARIDTMDRTDEGKPVEYSVAIWLPENPFTLPRKADRYSPQPWFRAIESIDPVEPRQMMCIKVDAEDELYVVQDYIVTHNTRWSSYFPKPIYADCEGGLASVADRRVPYVVINNSTDMADLLNHVKLDGRLPKDKRQYETVVIDTFDAYQRKLKNEWMEANKKEAFTGWEAWGFLDQKMQLLLTKLLNLDINVIVAVHYKDKVTRDDDKESHELMLQLSGEIKDTAFNDFDLVGWMGTYWEAVAGERVEKRGVTFKRTPDKPFLKDRLHVTPNWLEVIFAASDYENLFSRIAARAEQLSPSETIGEIATAEPELPGTVATPDRVSSGALPPQAPAQPVAVPLTQLDKPTLFKRARELGITTLPDGTPIKGNTLKGELIAAIEAHTQRVVSASDHLATERAALLEEAAVAREALNEFADRVVADTQDQIAAARAKVETRVPAQAGSPAVEQVAEGAVDTSTGELLDDGPPAVLEAKPPTTNEAIATVQEKLGGEVIAEGKTAAATEALARRSQSAPAPTVKSDAGNCEDCGKDLADESPDYIKLSRIKYRKSLCQSDYQRRKTSV